MQRCELTDLLKPLGLAHLVEQHILYPGQRRMQLVQALLSRLLDGKSLDAVQLPAGDNDDSLPQDERVAKKCQTILQMLGISCTPEQLRGCSGQQDRDTAPLLQMAKLLGVMEARRAANSRACSQQQRPGDGQEDRGGQQQPDAAESSKVTRLLAAAAGQLPKLLSETVQLFPTDLLDTLKTYTDQGALAQLPQLCQQAVQRAQELQQTLQELLAAGGSSCQSAGNEQWQQLVQDLDAALQRQLQEMQAFDTLYQQELTVWASGASTQTQQQSSEQQQWGGAQGAAASSRADTAEATGRMARSLMAGYQELQGLLDAVGTIMAQHSALQDVPAAVLQQQRDHHLQETYSLRMAASAVRPQRG